MNTDAEPADLKALIEFRHLSPDDQEADDVTAEVIALLERQGSIAKAVD